MKERRKGTNGEWQEVVYVQLEGSDILHKSDNIEFQNDVSNNEQNTNSQDDEEKHWQDIKEQATIAAMQGILSNAGLVDATYEYRIIVENAAIDYAERIVRRLRGK